MTWTGTRLNLYFYLCDRRRFFNVFYISHILGAIIFLLFGFMHRKDVATWVMPGTSGGREGGVRGLREEQGESGALQVGREGLHGRLVVDALGLDAFGTARVTRRVRLAVSPSRSSFIACAVRCTCRFQL